MLQNKPNNFRSAKRTKEKPVKKAPLKGTQSGTHQNLIMQIISARGFKSVVPTDEVLQTLDMTIHRFNKILDNKVGLTFDEAAGFATWLGVTMEELTTAPTVETVNLADKFGLKN